MRSSILDEEELREKRQSIGKIFKEARERQGLNQDELGDIIGIKKSSISKVESGSWNPTLDTILIFCTALNLDLRIV